MFDGGIPPLLRRSPIVVVVLLPLPPIPCPAGTSAPVPHLQDFVCGLVGRADTHQPPHCLLLRGEGGYEDGGEDCRHRRCRDDPDPFWGCGSDGPKGATTAGRDLRSPPPTSMAAMTAGVVAAGHHARCCHCWRRRWRGDNTTVTTATLATMTATMACTVMVASTATAATATARAPRCNRSRHLCGHSYLCLHALSFCVSCFFDCSH